MVGVPDPRVGETVLDPASGTGGFLVETYNHLAKQVKTVANRKVLQGESLCGCEPKPLPYLLCRMNLLLHGLDAPHIDPGNALRHRLTECSHTATMRARARGRDPHQDEASDDACSGNRRFDTLWALGNARYAA